MSFHCFHSHSYLRSNRGRHSIHTKQCICYLCMTSLACVCVSTGKGRANERCTSYRSGRRQRSRKINTLSASQHLSFHSLRFFFFLSHHHYCQSSCSTLSITHWLSFSLSASSLCPLSSPISSSLWLPSRPPQSSHSLCFLSFVVSPLCNACTLLLIFHLSSFSSLTLHFYLCSFFPTCVICHPIWRTILQTILCGFYLYIFWSGCFIPRLIPFWIFFSQLAAAI